MPYAIRNTLHILVSYDVLVRAMLMMSLSTYGHPTGDAGVQQTPYVQAEGMNLVRVYTDTVI